MMGNPGRGRRARLRRRPSPGFTLIELLVVVLIFGLLASIAFVMTAVVVPHSREHTVGRFDIVGSILMLTGRLEVFTVVALLAPIFRNRKGLS